MLSTGITHAKNFWRRNSARLDQEDHVLSHLGDATRYGVAADAGLMAAAPKWSSKDLLDDILSTLDNEKAEEVLPIALAGKSEMADHMVIATGRSSRQVSAMSEKLTDRLKIAFGVLCKVEGKDAGDWVLIDAGDVIVHLFRPEVREFYQLEKMWAAPGAPAGQG